MSRERFSGITTRLPGRIVSALARENARTQERRLAHEAGHQVVEEEIVTFPQFQIRECLDTRVFGDQVARSNMIYNQSVDLEEDSRLQPD